MDKSGEKPLTANEDHNAAVKEEQKEAGVDTTEENVNGEKDDEEQAIIPENVRKKIKFGIMKNLLIVSLGFLLLFTAFQSLQNLQSSLNPDQGLGLASLCVIYASLILSCMFVPPIMIGRLGCKWALVISMCCYVLYTIANYYAKWYTLIPASIFLGMLLYFINYQGCFFIYLFFVGIGRKVRRSRRIHKTKFQDRCSEKQRLYASKP